MSTDDVVNKYNIEKQIIEKEFIDKIFDNKNFRKWKATVTRTIKNTGFIHGNYDIIHDEIKSKLQAQ